MCRFGRIGAVADVLGLVVVCELVEWLILLDGLEYCNDVMLSLVGVVDGHVGLIDV